MTRSTRKTLTRRGLLKAASVSAGGAVAAPYVLTSTALGAPDKAPASERIVMGTIGIGGRGTYDMTGFLWNKDVQMVAVSDCQGDRRRRAKGIVDDRYKSTDCKPYPDARELLGRKDIDAVLIATGDNNHSLMSILAARAGKDIYCEKPLSVVIADSRAVAEAVQRYQVVFQCGTQRRNVGNFVFAVELARSGKLGKITDLHAEKAWPQSGMADTVLPAEKLPPKDEMDWDAWLGVAPWRPFNRKYYSRQFWKTHRDFSGGSICEWGSHTVDLCQWANSSDHTAPVYYEVVNDLGDIRATYADGVKLHIRKGLRFGSCPVRFEGTEGWVETGDSGQIETHPRSLLAERKFQGGYPADNHIREFLNCVKSRQTPRATADNAHHSITACHAANIAYILQRPLKFDPEREVFPDDAEANRMVSRAWRQPWRM